MGSAPEDIVRLVNEALEAFRPTVILSPETGSSLSGDWWSIGVPELDVQVCEYGLEAASAALCVAVQTEVRRRVEESALSEADCGLVLGLFFADATGKLAILLEAAHVADVAVDDPEFDL